VALTIGSIVVDCNDFPVMMAFWEAALRYAHREPVEDGFVILRDPAGLGPNVSIDRVPEPRSGKNRLHVDLYTTEQEAEVERLLALGATRHTRAPEPGEDFVVLADPEGNLFCVVDVGAA
jgi:hypothetical protein